MNADTCAQRCKHLPYYCTSYTEDIILKRDGWWSSDPELNPAFHDYFKVFVHHCSSDTFVGTKLKSNSTGNMDFMGTEIIKAVKDSLIVNFNMSNSKTIVLSGYSAGGFGAWRHCNEFFSGFNWPTDVRCLVDSGGFVPWRTAVPGACLAAYNYFISTVVEFQGHQLDARCLKDNENATYLTLECAALSSAYQYVDRPLFVTGNQFDTFYASEFCLICGLCDLDTTVWKQSLASNITEASTQYTGVDYYFRNCSAHDTAENYYNAKFEHDGKETSYSEAVNTWMQNSCLNSTNLPVAGSGRDIGNINSGCNKVSILQSSPGCEN